jgi:1,4-alpha-glucan branching enzyme
MSPAANPQLLTDDDGYLFNEGSHFRLYEKLGAHRLSEGGQSGTYFAVWAPNAERVSVIGDFNGWNLTSHPLTSMNQTGIWHGFFPDVEKGALYKYHVSSRFRMYQAAKADPFSCFNEIPPKFASIVWDLDYGWSDSAWMAQRHERNQLDKPMSIYEMHWARGAGSRARATGRFRTVRLRRCSPIICSGSTTPTSSSCP